MKESDLHIGHHIMATIEVKQLILSLDEDKERIIWALDAADELRKAVLEFVEEEETDD